MARTTPGLWMAGRRPVHSPARFRPVPATHHARWPTVEALGTRFDKVATRGYFRLMRAVAVKELKNRLSQYLREVAAGEVVLVTDRGKVIAELRRPSTGARLDFEQSLEPLVAQGLLAPGLPQDPRAYRSTQATLRRPSQALLDADRAEP